MNCKMTLFVYTGTTTTTTTTTATTTTTTTMTMKTHTLAWGAGSPAAHTNIYWQGCVPVCVCVCISLCAHLLNSSFQVSFSDMLLVVCLCSRCCSCWLVGSCASSSCCVYAISFSQPHNSGHSITLQLTSLLCIHEGHKTPPNGMCPDTEPAAQLLSHLFSQPGGTSLLIILSTSQQQESK